MNRFFDLDSPFMRALTKMADLVILNIVALLCCFPIVTIGASLTAMHYVLLKMARDEEGYIVRAFFKSFKDNFRQATIIWFGMLLFIVIFAGDMLILKYSGLEFPQILKVVLIAVAAFVYMLGCYVFPVLAHFENTVINTVRNALLMSVISLPKTVVMMVVYIVPVAVLLFPRLIPLVLFFGLSAPAYLSAKLYNGTFKRFEPEEEGLSDIIGETEDEDIQEISRGIRK